MRILVGMMLVLTSFSSFAGTWHSEKVRWVYPLANGDFVLKFITAPETCTSASKYFYIKVGSNGMTKEGAGHIYSLALTAASTGKAIKVYFDETSTLCYVNRAYVNFK